MREKVLNLEELANEIVRLKHPTKERIKEILRKHLKYVCKFYLKYHDMPELLVAGHPELASVEIRHGKTLKEFAEHYNDDVDEVCLNLDDFNEWLFRYVFREVITEEIEREVNNEQWKFIKLLEVMDEK